MSSSSSSSSSSAAAATVTVTARDIEFSNYNSSTGKWGNAALTMMIEDTDTADNLNMEVYDEKVYAVFRNHDDPTDLVQTSAEVDGMDFRVTISTPMVASAKYELYKVYGDTSHAEYATSSQFYIQVPGKVWDFANDTVEEDVELVSDWWDYGNVVTSDNVVHGFPTRQDAVNAAAGTSAGTVAVNGDTINVSDIIGYKLSSAFEGEVPKIGNNVAKLVNGYNSLQDFDIVSSGLTKLNNNSGNVLRSTSYNKKFAFPSTMVAMDGWFSTPDANNTFDKPVYLPDSVTRLSGFMNWGLNTSNFTSKVRLSPNIDYRGGYNLYGMKKWAGSVDDMSTAVQLPNAQNNHPYVFGAYTNWCKGLKNNTWTSPVAWTYIPNYWFYGNNAQIYNAAIGPVKIIVSEGVTAIYGATFYGLQNISEIKLPSTLTQLSSGFIGLGHSSAPLKMDMSACTSLTSLPSSFLNGGMGHVDVSELKLPPNLTTIGNYFMSSEYNSGFTYWYNWPVDENNKTYYAVPDGVTTIGSNCFGSLIANNIRLELPASVTSVGSYFMYTYGSGFGSLSNPREIDLSKFTPDMFAQSNYSFACYAVSTYQGFSRITVAPGTAEAWEERFPNIQRDDGYWTRHVEWVEKPTQYGYVFYKETVNSPEKYVELQSQAEFESLCNSNSSWSATIGEDQITVRNDASGNFITGVTIGTDITSVPNNFLRYCTRLTKRMTFPANVTSVGSGCMLRCTAFNNKVIFKNHSVTLGNAFMCGCQSFNQPLELWPEMTIGSGASQSLSFLGGCTSFNQPITLPEKTSVYALWFGSSTFNSTISFFAPVSTTGNIYTPTYLLGSQYNSSFNQPVVIPEGYTHLGQNIFSSAASSFNSTITFPSTLVQFGGLQGLSAFNQPFTIPNGVTRIRDGSVMDLTSFNQDITIPNSVTYVGFYFMHNCNSMTSVIDFQDVPATAITTSFDVYQFTTTDPNSDYAQNGMYIKGTYADAILARFPNGSWTSGGTTYYRNLKKYQEESESGSE